MVSEEKTLMQHAIDDLVRQMEIAQNAIETIRLKNDLGVHKEPINALMGVLNQVANALTIARAQHTVAILDVPFIVTVLEDVDLDTLTKVFGRVSADVKGKTIAALRDSEKAL